MKFEIREEFYIDGQPEKIISGAIHYFRVTPEKWYQSLHNLKALGANTVETYIPWNLHEPQPGSYNFEGIADLEAFLDLAQEMGLFIILRPSPYICAEWEFGGLPAWLLETTGRVRSQDPAYMAAVDRYYAVLIPKIAKYQFTQGGNLLMVQIENEYGSYSDDKKYLKMNRDLLVKYGIEVPFVTSDGGWDAVLEAGTLMDEDVLPTANFGSGAKENFAAVTRLMEKHGVKKPLMCMEFWDGCFNNWGKEIIVRDPVETAQAVKEVLELGSINLYMFHGGTSFGFMNGANKNPKIGYEPQVTSYDYDAPLDEAGNPTEKYYAIRQVIQELFPEKVLPEPISSQAIAYPTVEVKNQVTLFNTLAKISTPHFSDVTLSMEKFGQNTGYLLYQSVLPIQQGKRNLEIVDASDRVQVFKDRELIGTIESNDKAPIWEIDNEKEDSRLQVLVENRGRVNYGPHLVEASQHKGILGGVRQDIFFISQWAHYPLPLDNIEAVDFFGEWASGQPAFYQFELEIDQVADTYVDMSSCGKGVVFVNGFNLGRFWEIGPYYTLFLPRDLLKKGKNCFVVFETEGKTLDHLVFSDRPKKMN